MDTSFLGSMLTEAIQVGDRATAELALTIVVELEAEFKVNSEQAPNNLTRPTL